MLPEVEEPHTGSDVDETNEALSGAEAEFWIHEKLGEGGFGEVYWAIDL